MGLGGAKTRDNNRDNYKNPNQTWLFKSLRIVGELIKFRFWKRWNTEWAWTFQKNKKDMHTLVFVLYHLMSRQEFLTLRLFIEAYSNSQRGRQVGEQLTFLTIHSMHYTLMLDADQPIDMKSEQVGLGLFGGCIISLIWLFYIDMSINEKFGAAVEFGHAPLY